MSSFLKCPCLNFSSELDSVVVPDLFFQETSLPDHLPLVCSCGVYPSTSIVVEAISAMDQFVPCKLTLDHSTNTPNELLT